MGADLKQGLSALNSSLLHLSQQPLVQQNLLDDLTQYCVDHLGAAFARIWLIDPTGATLVLKSSKGQYTRLDGTRSRIPLGQGTKIDRMYTEGTPHITNDVLTDPGVKDKEWAKREGFISFAGHPLMWGEAKMGVLGMYSRQPLSEDILLLIDTFALLSSALIFQINQTERNMSKFCEVTGIRPILLERLISLGKEKDG